MAGSIKSHSRTHLKTQLILGSRASKVFASVEINVALSFKQRKQYNFSFFLSFLLQAVSNRSFPVVSIHLSVALL